MWLEEKENGQKNVTVWIGEPGFHWKGIHTLLWEGSILSKYAFLCFSNPGDILWDLSCDSALFEYLVNML